MSVLASLLVLLQSPSRLPANYVQVDAPTAQRLVVAEKNRHPKIKKLGLHAVPPQASDNVIIASDSLGKIGKKSSPGDLQHLAAGKPLALRELNKFSRPARGCRQPVQAAARPGGEDEPCQADSRSHTPETLSKAAILNERLSE